MNDPVLAAMYGEIERELRGSMLILLHEGRLESIAAEALVSSGASLIEGSNVPGRRWRIQVKEGSFVPELFESRTSQVRQHSSRGRPIGATSPDLTVELPSGRMFRIEIKTRCRFGSGAANASGTLLKDLSLLDAGSADALILAADFAVYENLRGDRIGKRGQKGNHDAKARFARVFPSPDLCRSQSYAAVTPEPERWHVRARIIPTEWGDRVLVALAIEDPEWITTIAQPDAPPNSGPTGSVSILEVTEEPPSVS